MRVLFMGTSAFAVPSLKALLEADHQVAGVWTRPDKPRGRGHHMEHSPVKAAAVEARLPVYQPRTLRDAAAAAEVSSLEPDAVCVAAYGLILTPEVLAVPRSGCINVHASLLPRYRGAAPIHRAILAGETVTGVTTMMMNSGLDTGDILLREEEAIGPDDTFGLIHDRLAERGSRLLVETLRLLQEGACPREPQDDSQASYAPPVQKMAVDWALPAFSVHNMVRGLNPTPGAYTTRGADLLRVHRTSMAPEAALGSSRGSAAENRLPGEFWIGPDRELLVQCGDGVLALREIQPAGKRMMSGRDYLLGRPIRADERLGGALPGGALSP